MNKIIAIALVVSTLFFGASAVLSLAQRDVVHTEDVGAYDEGMLPWLYVVGSAACFAGAIGLWTERRRLHGARSTPADKAA
jgi:hypothetical protein